MSEMKSLTLNGKTYDCFVDDVARSSVVITSASGENISVSDSSDRPLVGLNIYGKSIQNGTPTPDAPVDIESIGDDGNVIVTVGSNAMEVTLANGLRGIKVTDKSLATYTDANGQMWCADEVDFERGVYIQRVTTINAGEQYWTINTTWSGVNADCNLAYFKHSNMKYGNFLCAHFSKFFKNSGYEWTVGKMGMQEEGVMYAAISKKAASTNDGVKQYMASLGVVIYCMAVTPIETPLTADQIAAFKALYTRKPNTTAHNDSGAYMSIKYVADAKSYIDNKVSGILAATVE
jgi:hypothetical protein